MRIIGGTLKGRRIPFNNRKFGDARVTSDMLKKAVFTILGEDLPGQHFLDLFSGSGQIGLEAASRGAQVTMNEPDRRRHRFIADLIREWGIAGRVRLFCHPAQKLLPLLQAENLRFDIIYLDPPYTAQIDDQPAVQAMLARTRALADPAGLILAQHPRTLALPESPPGLCRIREKNYGNTALTIYRPSPE